MGYNGSGKLENAGVIIEEPSFLKQYGGLHNLEVLYRLNHKRDTEKFKKSLCKDKFVRYQKIFELACLLHDVGHSPFSHTGEEFYTKSKSTVCFMLETEMKKFQTEIDNTDDIQKKKELKNHFEEASRYSIYKHLAYLTNDPIFNDTITAFVSYRCGPP